MFNKLEEIVNPEMPWMPALGSDVTYASSKEHLPNEFGSDYMPSRINWAVQSSGVDYLHMLIVSMKYPVERYHIHARYLISVHDELWHLAKEEDKYRAALALQIFHLVTRAMFAYVLGTDNLPRAVAFFSAGLYGSSSQDGGSGFWRGMVSSLKVEFGVGRGEWQEGKRETGEKVPLGDCQVSAELVGRSIVISIIYVDFSLKTSL